MVFAVLVIGRVRAIGGVAVTTASMLVTGAVFSVVWVVMFVTLPRGTTDPGAVLPGAVLVGAGTTALQAMLQLYFPGRIERASETIGSWSLAVVTLGYLFLFGRLVATALVLNAVVFERVGSVSAAFFGFPGQRWIPRRWPRIAR